MKVILPERLKIEEVNDICMSYDHSFGLTLPDGIRDVDFPSKMLSGYTTQEREILRWKVEEFYRLIKRTLVENYKDV